MPQTLSSLMWIILISQNFCGYYTTMHKHHIFNIPARVLCIILIYITVYKYISQLYKEESTYQTYGKIYQLLYFLIGAIMAFIDGNVFSRFHSNVQSIMSEYSLKFGYRSVMRTITVFTVIFFMEIYIIWSDLAELVVTDLLLPFLFISKRFGFFTTTISRCIIFEWNYFSVKTLRISFDQLVHKSNATILEPNQKVLLDVVTTYTKLLKNINSVGVPLKITVLRDFVLTFFYVIYASMGIVYTPENTVQNLIVVKVSVNILTLFLPCVFMELTKIEVDKIRLIYVEISAHSSDEEIRRKADDALMLLQTVPFEFTVWRFISVNSSLPFQFFALLTTYVIVTMQFMHVFG
nr:gustatory receptor 16 [Pieris rapae]